MIISLPAELFLAGFVGTQRIWYLRAFRGDQFDTTEIWPLSWAFFLRYAALAIVTLVHFLPVLVVAHIAHGAARILIIAAGAVALDVALTFVTPALAYSTAELGEAWRIGRSMIREGWPVTAWCARALRSPSRPPSPPSPPPPPASRLGGGGRVAPPFFCGERAVVGFPPPGGRAPLSGGGLGAPRTYFIRS